MPRRALSKTKVSQIDSEVRDRLVKIAAERCLEERCTQANPRAVWKICEEVEAEYFQETKKHIKISRTTVNGRINGRQSIRDFNATKRWLDEAEEAMVVDFTIDTALRGFPLNHKRLKEHVNALCWGKYGTDGGVFPKEGVGREWTQRFVERHSTRLHPYWSRSLDHSRARAVNPTNIDSYFALLKTTIEGQDGEDPIEPDCIYGMDETGLQLGVGTKERVIGPAKKKVQYQQRSGDRENVTVLVTICADGTSITPAVIFKGDAYHPNWDQPNPGNAALAHSKKGYTDGEIGVEWIKLFHRQTEAKARGRRRLLLVDGHSSHYTFGFLEFAREHHIHVLCYPSHTTHILQGLDVAIFSSLKRHWTTARDEFERAGKKVNKTNFLSVYHAAHTNALTVENIHAAFRKTGVVPFDPSVVHTDSMLPSLETSIQGSLPNLRAVQASPIRAMARFLLDDVASRREHSSSSTPSNIEIPHTPNSSPTTPSTPPHKVNVASYEAEVRLAKRERREARLERPELRIEPRAPKPRLKDMRAFDMDDEEGDEDEEGDDDEDEDEDENEDRDD
uniref:Serine/threonine-protein kinase CST20 (EC) n=1 Tax=Ganoderma boninense TaxID=34458 RepID=A0A5K1JZK6_9APHY|nr:Serine/threonine-protein kinase CST20 (EC [Ganoderma boninense]